MTRKRFTVSMDHADYAELEALANGHSPPLTMTYVVNYALKRFLEQARDPQTRLRLADPLQSRRRNA